MNKPSSYEGGTEIFARRSPRLGRALKKRGGWGRSPLMSLPLLAILALVGFASGMRQETAEFRALSEAAALGPDFAEGRAAFAARRPAKFAFRGPTAPIK